MVAYCENHSSFSFTLVLQTIIYLYSEVPRLFSYLFMSHCLLKTADHLFTGSSQEVHNTDMVISIRSISLVRIAKGCNLSCFIHGVTAIVLQREMHIYLLTYTAIKLLYLLIFKFCSKVIPLVDIQVLFFSF